MTLQCKVRIDKNGKGERKGGKENSVGKRNSGGGGKGTQGRKVNSGGKENSPEFLFRQKASIRNNNNCGKFQLKTPFFF